MDINIRDIEISAEILALVAEIDEFKGAWRALGNIAPEQLSSLRRVATIESIGSSTRIEGSRLRDSEVEALLRNLLIKRFDTRDEQEVAGYSAVMDIIFENFEQLPLTENLIKQLHNELMRHSEKDAWHKGGYKKLANNVEAFDANGKSMGVVFETASPFETSIKMYELVEWANKAYAEKKLHNLLVTAIFIVSFLAIHPFQDGNGRLSRALTTYLLLKYGYGYVAYSSLEAIIEQNKEAYYLALRQTQGTLKLTKANWQPWILFFLKALKQQKHKLELKLEKEKLLLTKLPTLALQIVELAKSRGRITRQEIVILTNAKTNTVKKHLEYLAASNLLHKHGTGKGTWYAPA